METRTFTVILPVIHGHEWIYVEPGWPGLVAGTRMMKAIFRPPAMHPDEV